MRIYLAGVRDPRAKRVCSELGVRNYLLSFANQRAFGQNSDVLENPECRVMVDSGAFSVWNTGRKIDVKKYEDFAFSFLDDLRRMDRLHAGYLLEIQVTDPYVCHF